MSLLRYYQENIVEYVKWIDNFYIAFFKTLPSVPLKMLFLDSSIKWVLLSMFDSYIFLVYYPRVSLWIPLVKSRLKINYVLRYDNNAIPQWQLKRKKVQTGLSWCTFLLGWILKRCKSWAPSPSFRRLIRNMFLVLIAMLLTLRHTLVRHFLYI